MAEINVVNLVAALIEERVKNERLREALQKAEWVTNYEGGPDGFYCGVCGKKKAFGHTVNCLVGRALTAD